jgi:hypothetical protein
MMRSDKEKTRVPSIVPRDESWPFHGFRSYVRILLSVPKSCLGAPRVLMKESGESARV